MRGILRGEPCGDNVRAEPLLGRGVTHLPGESHRGKEECNDECNDEVPKRWSSSTGAASTGSPALFGLGGGCANRMVTGIVPMKDASCQASKQEHSSVARGTAPLAFSQKWNH